MKENDQSRFIRWGVPGWMMILSLLGFLIIDIMFTPESHRNALFMYLKDFYASTTITTTIAAAFAALLVAAAGVPLGFFIYQIYFSCDGILHFPETDWFLPS